MAQLQSIVEALSIDFCAEAMSKRLPFSGRHSTEPEPKPSSTQLRQVYRAFYRFEIYCRVFGCTPMASSDVRQNRVSSSDRYDWVLAKFKSWEVEEVASVYGFIQDSYDASFDELSRPYEVRRPIHRCICCLGSAKPCVGLPGLSSTGGYGFLYQQAWILRGLEFLYKVSAAASSQALCKLLEENLSFFYPSFGESLAEVPRASQIPPWWGKEDAPAEGDAGVLSHGDEGPNIGWLWAHHDKFSNKYNDDKGQEFGSWAYMIWDRERLKRWGIL